jgi:hypothetical protein
MKLKIHFLSGSWRTVECDSYAIDTYTITFKKGDEIVFTAILANTCYLEQASDLPIPLSVIAG